MNKFIIIFLVLFIGFIVIPGKYTERRCDSEILRLSLPITGCYSSCKGIGVIDSCKEHGLGSGCELCESTCYGYVIGSCGVNPISAKIRFLKSIVGN